MFHSVKLLAVLTGMLIATAGFAQAPAAAPAGSTGLCRDGSYWSGATKKGACRGHKGVQDWYAGSSTAAGAARAAAATAAPTPATPAAAPAPAAASVPAPAPTMAPKRAAAPTVAQAPGGGPGLVWVNTSSKVYHCPTDRYYGKTKNGSYMSESDAIAKGNRADRGKACSK